jgi:hypothetical protein
MICDAVDIGTLAYGLMMGEVGRFTAGLIGGAAVGAIGIAGWVLRDL